MSDAAALLRVRGFALKRSGDAKAEVEDLSFAIQARETLILLGDAGAGASAVMRFLAQVPDPGATLGGTIQIRDQPEQPLGKSRLDLRTAYLPGPHANILNPHESVVSQLALVIARKTHQPKASAAAELDLALQRLPGGPSLDALDQPPTRVAPEALAAGLLAAAMSQTPDLLLADDPLGQLSPAHARAFASALKAEQQRLGFAILYAALRADVARLLGGNLIVLRSGRLIEEGPVSRLATAQSHSYTQALFRASLPGDGLASVRAATRGEPLLRVQGVHLKLPGKVKDREKITFELRRGASLGLIGEIGSGRRSLTRALLGMEPLAAGRIVFDQVDIGVLSPAMMARLRRRVSFITGDDDALDPRMTIFDTVSEPLRAHLAMPRDSIAHNRDAALKRVGLAALPGSRTVASLAPFDRRRLQIARAIVSQPLLAVIDEPLHGLDAFAQSVVRDLLRNFRSNEGAAILFITSDFGLARAFCEDGLVFKDSRIVERGTMASLLRAPQDPHTRKLLEAVAALPVQSGTDIKPVAEDPVSSTQPPGG